MLYLYLVHTMDPVSSEPPRKQSMDQDLGGLHQPSLRLEPTAVPPPVSVQTQMGRAAREIPDTAYNISVAWTFPQSDSL